MVDARSAGIRNGSITGADVKNRSQNAIQVGTADADGTAADRPFHVVLSC